MNRLVIIGNGFDLAHGLPTSYRDFIDDYWTNIKDNNHNELVEFNIESYVEFNGHQNLNDLIDLIVSINGSFKREGISVYKLKDIPKALANNRVQILNYKNYFFKVINQNTIKNWVDIENIYYENLKEIAKGDINKLNYIYDIKKLNEEFEQVKNLFEKYLFDKVFKVYNFHEYADLQGNILRFPHLFKPITYKDESEEMKRFLDEFPKPDQGNIKNQFIFRGDELVTDCKTTFLNFNYTPTLWNYSNILKRWNVSNEVISIHGSLNDSANVINFGFGDEMDDDYKMIENINDNEYLKNFKSFQYLQNANYKTLLDFIDSEKFQVFIMGHSCGLSDRTLLNTVFEHNNCRSIKVFYHQRKDGSDNYTEIIQNISRHFNKKKLMREKIVNKTLCQFLPQVKLPGKV